MKVETSTMRRAAQQPDNSGTPRTGQRLRDILAIDERERLIEFAQTWPGRLAAIALGILLATVLSGHPDAWWQQLPQTLLVCGGAAACAYLPKYRSVVVLIASYAVLVSAPWWFPLDGIRAVMLQEHVDGAFIQLLVYVALGVFILGAWLALAFARRQKTSLIARRPVVVLLSTVTVLGLLADLPMMHGMPRVWLWSFLTVFTPYIWFLSYALVDLRSRDCSPPLFQLGIFHPFWGSTTVPWGKGAAFLRKTQSKTNRELAITQIKALKLLFWAIFLGGLKTGLAWLVLSRMRMPDLSSVQSAYFNHHPFPVLVSWSALIMDKVLVTLSMAMHGHKIIALARLAGFRLPRNMRRPLEARTLAEFWNRYYYYFKELLVEFFFVPTFLRTFRKHPRLRMFFSTFMAAGVGNAIFHFLSDFRLVATLGWSSAVETFTSYLFYCAVLATGIGISQVRTSSGANPPTTRLGKLLAFLWVWTFVICLNVFGNETRVYSLDQRLSFMASLMGIN